MGPLPAIVPTSWRPLAALASETATFALIMFLPVSPPFRALCALERSLHFWWRLGVPESSADWGLTQLPDSRCAGEEHGEGLGKSHRIAGGQVSSFLSTPTRVECGECAKDVAICQNF